MYVDDVRFAVDTSRIHEHHVPHVKVRFPGIVARVRFTDADGKVVEGDVLIDGHHRAVLFKLPVRGLHNFLLDADGAQDLHGALRNLRGTGMNRGSSMTLNRQSPDTVIAEQHG